MLMAMRLMTCAQYERKRALPHARRVAVRRHSLALCQSQSAGAGSSEQVHYAPQASGNGPTSGNASQAKSLDDTLLGAMLPKNAPVAGASTGSTGAVDHAQSAALQGMLHKNAPVAGATTGSTGALVLRPTTATPMTQQPAGGGVASGFHQHAEVREAQRCFGVLSQEPPMMEGIV